ncbi:hypothetical protein [Microbacterium gorillae]|uniref:hypothetical protein n=1 Tax=Microbacterium gorillae TaxID=1231063 RepID=UPI00058C39D8|nr:hypothetical protein [Microbacterium gorillae]
MRARVGVILMTLALALYIGLVGQRAYLMLTTGDTIAIIMGVALIVLPLIAIWGIGRELLFGRQAEKLGSRLEAEGGLPPEEVNTYASGRVHREDADALFPKYRAEVEQHPDDWRTWYRLGLVYDGAGDRRRARDAIRRAIRLSRSA